MLSSEAEGKPEAENHKPENKLGAHDELGGVESGYAVISKTSLFGLSHCMDICPGVNGKFI